MSATLAEDAWSLAFGTLSLDDGMAMREGTAWRLMPGNDPDRFAGLLSVADLDAWAALGTRRSTSDPGTGVVHPAKRLPTDCVRR